MKKTTQLRITIFATLFIILIVTTKITDDIRSDAQRALGIETEISAKKNKQVISLQEAKEDYERWERENLNQY